MASLGTRLQNAWNAFVLNKDVSYYANEIGHSYTIRPDRPYLRKSNERTIVNAILSRIANDVASIDIKHVRLDINGRMIGTIDSTLNNCLTMEANIDQTGRSFIHDAVLSMLDEGVVALVPIDVNVNLVKNNTYEILTIRTGKIMEWYPRHIKVNVYNDRTGQREDVIVPKDKAAIIENPFYSVMNEPNSTLKRLVRKLSLLDTIDDKSANSRLDLIVQLPFSVKSELKKEQAERRRRDIEFQLMNSKYGIAYIDSTEHVTQLNRTLDNNIMKQVEYLTSMLYSQLGISATILDGTATEEVMQNYQTRIIEPITSAFANEMTRKFLTKTARTQGQAIRSFMDPFRLVPVSKIASIADTFTRNEIMTSNEIRQIVGMAPSADPSADELRNKNLSQSSDVSSEEGYAEDPYAEDPYAETTDEEYVEEDIQGGY